MTSITVCIATMRRESVADTLASLNAQTGLDGVDLDIVVADNDDTPSAKDRIATAAAGMTVPVTYVHAPARNISLARNAGLDTARGQWAAFIDDDEVAAPDWLARMLARAEQGFDVVIGPAVAVYGPEAPAWMKAHDYHSNRPTYRDGQVQTGHTCNAIVRRSDPKVAAQRFLLSKGRSGGEDTEYFFRLWKMGLRLGAAEDALVYEAVNPARLNFKWIATRKFRAGQSYGYSALKRYTLANRAALFLAAAGKVLLCAMAVVAFVWSKPSRNFWVLRAIMHLGVASSVLGVREPEIY